MRTVDIDRYDLVHRLLVTDGGTRTRVEADCDHADPESVLAILRGVEFHCDWPAAVLQHLLRRQVPFEEACAWSQLPVKPQQVHWMVLWKRPDLKQLWALEDLERWRAEGRTPEQAAAFCARYPYRVGYPKGPS